MHRLVTQFPSAPLGKHVRFELTAYIVSCFVDYILNVLCKSLPAFVFLDLLLLFERSSIATLCLLGSYISTAHLKAVSKGAFIVFLHCVAGSPALKPLNCQLEGSFLLSSSAGAFALPA